jgi:predicted nucleic acid-binding Zn ribbon protein
MPDPSDETDRGAAQGGGSEAHDPTGLQLARTIAGAVGRQVRRRKPAPRPRPVEPQVSGAHPDERDPALLSAALERLVESRGWSTDLNLHTLLARWPTLVGPTNAAHSHPESYADTVLTVRADSTAWATQLRTMAPQLVARLSAELGQQTVTRVVVRGPDAPSWKRGPRSVRGRGPRDTYG